MSDAARIWGEPTIDVRPTHIEVWWRPLPRIEWGYRVLRDWWDYKHDGLPVRFVYEISQE